MVAPVIDDDKRCVRAPKEIAKTSLPQTIPYRADRRVPFVCRKIKRKEIGAFVHSPLKYREWVELARNRRARGSIHFVAGERLFPRCY